MTKLEVYQEFARRLLEIVILCDQDIVAAYEKRDRAATELNEWFLQAYTEAAEETLLETAQGLKGEALDAWLESLTSEEVLELLLQCVEAMLDVLNRITEASNGD